MELAELVEQVPSFDSATPKDKVKFFAWWLHAHGGKETFGPADIRACSAKIHVDEPPALATYIARMEGKELIKLKGAYKLVRSVRTDLDKTYGVHHSVIVVSKILTGLPGKMPSVDERAFLNEALKCYRNEAYRSCIVMVWNLAYSHLLDWLLKDQTRLGAFNGSIGKRNSKKAGVVIGKYDDFEELKEREVIDICNIAGLFNSSVYKILVEKLGRRNIAAHPSAVVIVQSQADDAITDLVNNVILNLA